MEGVSSGSQEDSEVLVCIINTCTVTQKAEQKARRLMRLILKKYPNCTLIATGCYAQLASSEIEKMDKRICVIGGQMKSRLSKVPQLLKSALSEKWDAQAFVNLIEKEISSLPQL